MINSFDPFSTLIAKTFVVLLISLGITYFGAWLIRQFFKRRYNLKQPFIKANKTYEDGSKDLHIDAGWQRLALWLVSIVQSAAFFILIIFVAFDIKNLVLVLLTLAVFLFLTGVEISLAIINIDDKLAEKALRLTIICVIATGLMAFIVGVDISGWGTYLLVALFLLILLRFSMLRIDFGKTKGRLVALFAIILFNLYLLYDFSKLVNENKISHLNTWSNALDIAISIYLSIVNLFINILDYFGGMHI